MVVVRADQRHRHRIIRAGLLRAQTIRHEELRLQPCANLKHFQLTSSPLASIYKVNQSQLPIGSNEINLLIAIYL